MYGAKFMQCELCGRECNCISATIDNVKMMLCPNCLKKHGKGIKDLSQPKTPDTRILKRIKKPREKDLYKTKDMDKKLVSNYAEIIKNARQKKDLTREKLGFNIGERTVTISKIENGDLKPSDKIAEKLEKELNIVLFEEIEKVPSFALSSHKNNKGLTLGDFIKKE